MQVIQHYRIVQNHFSSRPWRILKRRRKKEFRKVATLYQHHRLVPPLRRQSRRIFPRHRRHLCLVLLKYRRPRVEHSHHQLLLNLLKQQPLNQSLHRSQHRAPPPPRRLCPLPTLQANLLQSPSQKIVLKLPNQVSRVSTLI